MKTSFFRRIPRAPAAFAAAAGSALLATAISRAAFGPRQLADAAMLYLLSIVLVSLRAGYGPSLLAAVLSVLCFDFFFIPPLYTFAIRDLSHVVTFAVMSLVALLISGLTQRVRAQARAAQRAQLQMDTEQMRSSLLSSVSHDLRTPLAVVTGAASSLLEDEIDAATRRELTETILQEAQRLDLLVRNLLDMTRLEAGAVRINKEWQPLEEVIGSALDRFEGALAGRAVLTELAADLPLVPLDAVLIQQLLVNLLENALKYTKAGSPIELRARARPGAVDIVVADRGPGIPPGEEQRVFDKFYRVRGVEGGGVGLGLAICKGIVMAHGGQIFVVNRAGGGAEFHISLPIDGEPAALEARDPVEK
jgi:two-component system sensor histidine kinase KdpD